MNEAGAPGDVAARGEAVDDALALSGLIELSAVQALVQGFALTHEAGLAVLDPSGECLASAPGEVGGEPRLRIEMQLGDESLGTLLLGPLDAEQLATLPEALRRCGPFDLKRSAELHDAALSRGPGLALGLTQLLRTVTVLAEAGLRAREAHRQHVFAAISALRVLEDRALHLSEVNARLQALDRMKSVFLVTISHELRTPLTSIMGYAEMLSEGLAGALGDEQAEYVRIILSKGESLMGLINSVMDLTRLEDGRLRLELQTFSLVALLEDARSTLGPQAHKKGLKLSVEADPVAGVQVVGDRERLKQLLVNLLANAVKFTPTGGRVALRAMAPGYQAALGREGVCLEVVDTGPGIPPAYAELIFQSFYQVDSTNTRAHGGAGLGLAIAKGIAEAHGGQVRLEQRDQPGACFVVLLPLEAQPTRRREPPPPDPVP